MQAGAAALGLVFYPGSPRCLPLTRARELRQQIPPFVSVVAVFVNAPADDVRRVLDAVAPDILQFHGDESPDYCRQFRRPYLKACRVREGTNLLEYLQPFSDANGWLLDSYVDAYGGVGEQFDWSMVPARRDRPLVLSGGLSPSNVASAIRQVRPWGVDVSTGVEAAKGIKDPAKIEAFMTEVANADA